MSFNSAVAMHALDGPLDGYRPSKSATRAALGRLVDPGLLGYVQEPFLGSEQLTNSVLHPAVSGYRV